jgi:hypothetical protein
MVVVAVEGSESVSVDVNESAEAVRLKVSVGSMDGEVMVGEAALRLTCKQDTRTSARRGEAREDA